MAFTENIDNIFLVLGKSTKKHDKAMIGFAVEQKPKKPGFSKEKPGLFGLFFGKKAEISEKIYKKQRQFQKGL